MLKMLSWPPLSFDDISRSRTRLHCTNHLATPFLKYGNQGVLDTYLLLTLTEVKSIRLYFIHALKNAF